VQIVAVDWSGAVQPRDQRRSIWTAVVEADQLTSLTHGLTRQEVIDKLKAMADHDAELIVGLDFSFSFPAWFIQERSLESVSEVWRCVAVEAEGWLARCEPPFWGRAGTKKTLSRDALFRRTETAFEPVSGIMPKSVFQLYGPGNVGAGSLRGMPLLRDLRDSGFSIWPFDAPAWPRAIEIYPRILTGAVVKSDRGARQIRLELERISTDLRALAEESDDAFDAAISALTMSRHIQELRELGQTTDQFASLEGEIWVPHVDPETPR
jgi:predicted nuclease with RNAse H fold